MKKLFLFVAAAGLAFSLNSCSSSGGGSSPGGTVEAKINGTAKTFNTVVVNEQTEGAGTAEEYTILTVTAAIGTSATELITFQLDKEDLGSDAIYSFYYTKDGSTYYGSVATNVTTNNTGKKLIGSFSGTVSDGTTDYTFTDGTINVQY
jgi:hypothetical protein